MADQNDKWYLSGPLVVNGAVAVDNGLSLAQDSATSTGTWHLENAGGSLRIADRLNPSETAGTERLRIEARPESCMLIVGGTKNGGIKVRHIDGKDWQTENYDTLHLNYETGKFVQVGSNGNPANLSVYGGLIVNDLNVIKKLEDLERELRSIKDGSTKVARADTADRADNVPHIESGTLWIDANAPGWNLLDGKGDRSFIAGQIQFCRPFNSLPTVIVSLNAMFSNKFDWVSVGATDIDQNGFKLKINTWGDALITGVGITWMASDAYLQAMFVPYVPDVPVHHGHSPCGEDDCEICHRRWPNHPGSTCMCSGCRSDYPGPRPGVLEP